MIKTVGMQRLEQRLGRPVEQVLFELYCGRGLTMEAVGRELGVSKASAVRYIGRCGIPTRPGGRAPVAVAKLAPGKEGRSRGDARATGP